MKVNWNFYYPNSFIQHSKCDHVLIWKQYLTFDFKFLTTYPIKLLINSPSDPKYIAGNISGEKAGHTVDLSLSIHTFENYIEII